MKVKIQLVVYWAIVLIPLTWGVYKTLEKTGALFSMKATPSEPGSADQSTPAPASTSSAVDNSATPAASAVQPQASPEK